MQRRLLVLFVAILAVVAANSFCLTVDAADNDCSGTTVMKVGPAVNKDNSSALDDAVRKLWARGVCVTIIMVEDTGFMPLDEYVKSLQPKLHIWNGNPKANHIVLALSVKPKLIQSYMGSNWKNLDKQWPEMLRLQVNPLLMKEDYDGGMAKALSLFDEILAEREDAHKQTQTPVVPVKPEQADMPRDYILLLLPVVILIGVLVKPRISAWKKNRKQGRR